jgi:hypothetical protein
MWELDVRKFISLIFMQTDRTPSFLCTLFGLLDGKISWFLFYRISFTSLGNNLNTLVINEVRKTDYTNVNV